MEYYSVKNCMEGSVWLRKKRIRLEIRLYFRGKQFSGMEYIPFGTLFLNVHLSYTTLSFPVRALDSWREINVRLYRNLIADTVRTRLYVTVTAFGNRAVNHKRKLCERRVELSASGINGFLCAPDDDKKI